MLVEPNKITINKDNSNRLLRNFPKNIELLLIFDAKYLIWLFCVSSAIESYDMRIASNGIIVEHK